MLFIINNQNMNFDQERIFIRDYQLVWLGSPDTIVLLKKYELFNIPEPMQELPNFTNFDQLITLNTKYKAAIYGMINQQTNQDVIVKRFLQLMQQKKVCDICSKDSQDLKRQYKQNILRLYSKDSFFYKYLNNILRKCPDLTQIFYIQPFVKRMFETIKSQYQTKKSHIADSLVLYRGGKMSQQEIQRFENAKGKDIESLGFLSTSKKKEIAFNFCENFLMQITVQQQQRNQKFDHGYVFLDQNSQYQQEQVLFNVLSSFRVKNSQWTQQKQKKVFYIQLNYGSLAFQRSKFNLNPKQYFGGNSIFDILLTQTSLIPYCQKQVLIQSISSYDFCKVFLQIILNVESNLQPTLINKMISLETKGMVLGLHLLAGKLSTASNFYTLHQLWNISQPEISDKIKERYNGNKGQLLHCHDIIYYLLQSSISAIYNFFIGNFDESIVISDNAFQYIEIVEAVRPSLLPNERKYLNSNFHMLGACKFFCMLLQGRVKEGRQFFAETLNKLHSVNLEVSQDKQIALKILSFLFESQLTEEQQKNYKYKSFVKGGIGEILKNILSKVKLMLKNKKDLQNVNPLTSSQKTAYFRKLIIQQDSGHGQFEQLCKLLNILRLVPVHIDCIQNRQQKLETIQQYYQFIEPYNSTIWSQNLVKQIRVILENTQSRMQSPKQNMPGQIPFNLILQCEAVFRKYINQKVKDNCWQQAMTVILELENFEQKFFPQVAHKFSLKYLKNFIKTEQNLFRLESEKFLMKQVGILICTNIGEAYQRLTDQNETIKRKLGVSNPTFIMSLLFLIETEKILKLHQSHANHFFQMLSILEKEDSLKYFLPFALAQVLQDDII